MSAEERNEKVLHDTHTNMKRYVNATMPKGTVIEIGEHGTYEFDPKKHKK